MPELDDAPLPHVTPSTLAGLSVLVIEDKDDAREFLRALLQNLGARVSVARDGREGLDMLQQEQPDLVLCDLRMPRMDGFEFMRELQGKRPENQPLVVAVSGLASEADLRRTREAGFTAHLKKPFDDAAVVAAVSAALGGREARELPRG